jgi:hypothetical protein
VRLTLVKWFGDDQGVRRVSVEVRVIGTLRSLKSVSVAGGDAFEPYTHTWRNTAIGQQKSDPRVRVVEGYGFRIAVYILMRFTYLGVRLWL